MNARTLSGFCLIAVALLVVTATPAHAEDEVLHDRWYAKFQGGHKTGWEHMVRVRSVREDVTVYVTETESRTVRGPDGTPLDTPIVGTSRFEEDENGVVLSYATSVDIGMGPQTRSGTTKDGKIACVADGKERTVDYPEGALGPAAVERALVATLKPNGKGSAVTFQPLDPATTGKVSWKVPDTTQMMDVLGVHGWFFVVTKDDGALPEQEIRDGAGRLWGGAFNLGTVRYLSAEKVVALADRDPQSWLTDRLTAPDRAIPAEATERVVLRLSREGDEPLKVPESSRQRIVKRNDDGSIDVELLRGEPKGDLVVWMRPYNGDDIDASYFADNPWLVLEHPRVPAMAKGFVGELQDALSCARVLELRVKQSVRMAGPNVGFQTAPGVISSGTGDSTATAVLVTALARSLGIPARIVSGFTYWRPERWPGEQYPKGAFGWHVWAEIYAGEKLWHPVDPLRCAASPDAKSLRELMGKGGVGPTHVAVVRSALDTETPFTDLAVPVLELMDGLTIEVLEPAE
jgi:hypothetical protein